METIFEATNSPHVRVLAGSQRTRGLGICASHLFDSLRFHFLLARLLPPLLLARLFGRLHELGRHRVRHGQVLLQLVLQEKGKNANLSPCFVSLLGPLWNRHFFVLVFFLLVFLGGRLDESDGIVSATDRYSSNLFYRGRNAELSACCFASLLGPL
jgi:hypothetical protein